MAGVQAVLVAWEMRLLFGVAAATGRPAPGRGSPGRSTPWREEALYLAWMALLSAASSLPFFTSFVMPDVFAGAAGAAALIVLLYWDRLSGWARAGTLALLVFAISTHRSNLLLVLALAAAGGALLWVMGAGGRVAGGRAGVLAASAAASAVLGALVFLPIAQRAGEPVRDPPFLMARVLADGPGRRFLNVACARAEAFAVCRYRRLPPEDSDTLLWSNRKATGLFGVSDYPTRLRLEAEEPAFVLRALAYDPVGEIEVAAENAALQLGRSHVKSPLADPSWLITDLYWRRTSLPLIIPQAQACVVRGRCASHIPVELANAVQDAALGLSLLAAAACVLWGVTRPGFAARLRRTGRPRDGAALADERVRALALLGLTGVLVLVNAAVCGALSAPVPRYEARLIWLVPAVAMLAARVLRPLAWRWPIRRRGSIQLNESRA